MEQFQESSKSLFWFLVVNAVTTLRLFFALIIVGLAITQQFVGNLMFGLIFGGGLTDLFDGMLAKAFKVQTRFGALYDKGVDKIFISTVGFSLYYCTPFPSLFWNIAFLILILILVFLEALLSLFGGFFASRHNTRLEASNWGKFKMDSEVITVCVWADILSVKLLRIDLAFGIKLVFALLIFSIGLACLSGYGYWCDLKMKK